MVRVPHKTCRNLYRLLEEADLDLLVRFLDAPPFKHLAWLKEYRLRPDQGGKNYQSMLEKERKERLDPLEREAARVLKIAAPNGQYALDGLAKTSFAGSALAEFNEQRDDLARSFWTYVSHPKVFEAAENTLHLRLYRRFNRHYQTFPVAMGNDKDRGHVAIDEFIEDLKLRMDRGEGLTVERFDIPAEGDKPESELYLVFHPDPLKSVRQIDDAGNRSNIYFRPPGEAMVVYTPSLGRVHVRAGTRALRHEIAQSFIREVLEETPSSQPVDFQAYDIARMLNGFELDLPDFEDVTILRAQVIRVDVSIGNLANRLSITTTIDQDLTELIEAQPGLASVISRALAIRFVEIAVRFRRGGGQNDETVTFTLTDRNTSSLLSLDDPFESALGHRLLKHWGIYREGRALTEQEEVAVLPALIAIWELGTDRVAGAWLEARNFDVKFLIDIGVLVLAGWEGDDVLDDEDDLGQVAAEVVPHPQSPELRVAPGQESTGGSTERYRVYRIRDGWVRQHLLTKLSDVLDSPAVEEMNPNLFSLGSAVIDGRNVPIYVARSLADDKVQARTDTELRARADRGAGLVLQAGQAPQNCIAVNVLSPIMDHIEGDYPDLVLSWSSLVETFRRDRQLALGGQSLEFKVSGDAAGLLCVSGRGTIQIEGANRVKVISRLVDAHNRGRTPISTGELTAEIEGQSLANIFGQPLWDKLKADFLRSPKNGRWEINH